MQLPKDSEIHLVSHDKGFSEGDKLSTALVTEAESKGLKVSLHKSLGKVLEILQNGTPPLDLRRVNDALSVVLAPVCTKLQKQWDLMPLGEAIKEDLTPYYTERVGEVFVTFTREYRAVDELVGDTQFATWRVAMTGSFNWDTDTAQLRDLRVERETLLGDDGQVLRQNATINVEMPSLVLTARVNKPFKTRGPL